MMSSSTLQSIDRAAPGTNRRLRAGALLVSAAVAVAGLPAFASATPREVPISTAGCGDGVQVDGELCLNAAVKATTLSGEVQAVETGLFNKGQHRDFVVAGTSQDSVRIKLGDGDGSFAKTYSYSMGNTPTDVAVADFNGDGYKDIATSSAGDDQVNIRWGHDYWSSWSKWNVGDLPRRIKAGHLNGDNRADFVTVNGLGETLTVRRRLAAGFDSQTYPSGNPSTNPRDAELADCDADGDLDLLYTAGIGEDAALSIRRNRGDGHFDHPARIMVGSQSGTTLERLVAGDLNNDGRPDLVILRNTHSMLRLLGQGNCSFGPAVAATTASNPSGVDLADLDRDGNLDIVLSHFTNDGNVAVYLGNGDGNVAAAKTYPIPSKLFDVDTADFNLDGTPDVVVAGHGGAWLLLSNP